MIFIFILVFGVLFLFMNLRQMAPGNKGSIAAGLMVVLLPVCFMFREQYWACVGQAFLSVWLCEALLLYIAWWIARGVRRAIMRRPLPHRASVIVARVLFAVSVAASTLMCAVGYFHEANYQIRELKVNLPAAQHSHEYDSAQHSPEYDSAQHSPEYDSAPHLSAPHSPEQNTAQDSAQLLGTRALSKSFSALFFTDLHISPLFAREKMERMIHSADSVKPDLILFGGDFSDIMDSAMTELGYDTLVQKLVATARVGAFAVNGNHEGYMERSGSDINGWLRRVGFTVLDDSTACIPLACITGRTDVQVARARDMERKLLAELAPKPAPLTAPSLTDSVQFDSAQSAAVDSRPWIVVDHQPKGIEPGHIGRLPDLALSGHTHDGQFFPGTVIIDWVWRLAYGFSTLDGVPWLVSSGVGSWGPPVRIGSDTEMWILYF